MLYNKYGDIMRLRNVKNKQQIMDHSSYLVKNPENYRGSWKEYFKNSHPIHIEIGTGKGNFIIQMALKYPEINFIGIEKYDSVIARALEKIPEGLPNLCMIRRDALQITDLFNHEIETIYLNFSDPWPKCRQAKRRLTSEVFLEQYESIFSMDALIIQKTDNQGLFEYSLCSLSQHGYQFLDLSLDLHHSKVEENVMTEYEEKFSRKGQAIFYVVATKKLSSQRKKD